MSKVQFECILKTNCGCQVNAGILLHCKLHKAAPLLLTILEIVTERLEAWANYDDDIQTAKDIITEAKS